MAPRKTLYLLRRPVADPTQSLLPSATETQLSDQVSLVLLEAARSSAPAFPGPVYVLHQESDAPVNGLAGKIISYRDLVTLIAEHHLIIVL